MSFIITILNFVGVFLLYRLDYRLVEGLDRFNLEKELNVFIFLFLFIAFTLYKGIMFYIYDIKWTIFDLKYVFLKEPGSVFNKEISIVFKILTGLGLLLDVFFFFGISFLFLKVMFVEYQWNLSGRIPLLGVFKFFLPLDSNYYLYKIYTTLEKESFMEAITNNYYQIRELKLKELNIQNLKIPSSFYNRLLASADLLTIKDDLYRYYDEQLNSSLNQAYWWYYIKNIDYKLAAITLIGTVVGLYILNKLSGLNPLQNWKERKVSTFSKKQEALFNSTVTRNNNVLNQLDLYKKENIKFKELFKDLGKRVDDVGTEYNRISSSIREINREHVVQEKKLTIILRRLNTDTNKELSTLLELRKINKLSKSESVILSIVKDIDVLKTFKKVMTETIEKN